jgi:hypothetical protein
VWVKRGDEWVLTEDVPVSLQEIPMVPVYTGRTGFWTADPPLLDLAWKNIEHWQSSSDQRNILHVARVPFLASDNDVRDDPNAPVTLKASGIITGFENLRFVEHSGAAIGAGRTDLMDLEDQMRRLAGELLARNTGDKTATETGLEASQGAAWLKAKVRTYQDALEECLRLHGAWIKDATPSTVTINCEWDDEALQADMITALTALRTAGGMSQDSLIWNMEKGGLLPPGRNIEEEKSLIEAEGPSGMEMLDSPSNLPPKKPKTVKITRPNGSVSTVSME